MNRQGIESYATRCREFVLLHPGLVRLSLRSNTRIMNCAQFFHATFRLPLLVLLSASAAAGQSNSTTVYGTYTGLETNGPAVYRAYTRVAQSFPGPALSYLPLSTNLPLALRRDMLMFRALANLIVIRATDKVLDHVLPESLNYLVWTNFIAHTNGRSMAIWSVRSRPRDWPASPPIVQWNPHSLMWGMKGLTALSPSSELGVNPGQAPITALTRRHGFTLGHSMREDRIGTVFAGMKVWFVTRENTLVQTTVKREIVRTWGTSGRDYTILIFSSDLPESIEPMRVISQQDVFWGPHCKYLNITGAPSPIFETEQIGYVSAGVPGFTVNTSKGGDSGSPHMLPLPGELVFFGGSSDSGPSREMQVDMDTLSRLEGLDPRKYQLQWVDLSRFPSYSSQ
jgi:hypothetical protein